MFADSATGPRERQGSHGGGSTVCKALMHRNIARLQVKMVASTFTLKCNLSRNSFKARAQAFLTSREAYF